ncbi:MAG: hypothetical protein RLZZ398_2122 [Verrucomicrobiota bacterium]
MAMSLDAMVDLYCRCHRLAPFINYNGCTLSAIARSVIGVMELPKNTDSLARSFVGHIVAGVASEEEVLAFLKFCV